MTNLAVGGRVRRESNGSGLYGGMLSEWLLQSLPEKLRLRALVKKGIREGGLSGHRVVGVAQLSLVSPWPLS